MAETSKTSVSAWVDRKTAENVERLAKAKGVTRSVLIQQLIEESVQGRMEYNGPDGSVPLRLVGQLNVGGFDRPLDPDHAAVELWELEDDSIWPRHFVRVFAEYDEDGGGSSECWYLCRGAELEKIDPDAWVKKRKRG